MNFEIWLDFCQKCLTWFYGTCSNWIFKTVHHKSKNVNHEDKNVFYEKNVAFDWLIFPYFMIGEKVDFIL